MRRWRTFLAGIALALWIAAYAVGAVSLANMLFGPDSSTLLQTVYYLVAGFGWIPLCIPILKFAARDSRPHG